MVARVKVGAEASVASAASLVGWEARQLESAAEAEATDLGWLEGSEEGALRGVDRMLFSEVARWLL